MDNGSIARAVKEISALMRKNRDYLVELDQVNGDGDLGISMDDGFRALAEYFDGEIESDLGQSLRQASKVLNSAAPSSLGTILSFGLMGMAKELRGKETAQFDECIAAFDSGIENIKDKAGSKPGEKTILDALDPAVAALKQADPASAFDAAAQAASNGSDATRGMRAVHGRAAVTADRSIGILDGGSVVGKLIFEGIAMAQTLA